MNFMETLNAAGLGTTDISRLLGVSRTAVFNWQRRRSTPHSMIKDKLTELVRKSEILLEAGKLPIKCPRNERCGRLRKLFSAT